jgi:hypothetical protein
MGIDGDIPSKIEADDHVKDNEKSELGGAKVQIKADERT